MKRHYFCFIFIVLVPALYAQTESSVTADPEYTITPIVPDSLSLDETLKQLGGELVWDTFFNSGVFVVDDHKAVFTAGFAGEPSYVLYDSSTLLNLPSPWLDGGELRFPNEFVAALKSNIEESRRADASRFRIAAIIVDPGHGGKDAGASGDHTISGKKVKATEKDIVLKVSKDLFSKLQKTFPDKRLIMTRTGDTYPTLEDRVTKAHSVSLKENEAIIYISVHANASFNKNARGFEVWYLSPEYRREVIDKKKTDVPQEVVSIFNDLLEEEFTTESVLLSQSIADELGKTFGKSLPSRGIKAEDWYVVRKARMPSVLVELGFVTNTEDSILMLNQSQKFADAIFKGITNFVKRFESSGGFTEVAAQ